MLDTLTYLRRYVAWRPWSIQDFRRFPGRTIKKAETPFLYPRATGDRVPRDVTYCHDGRPRTVGLDALLAETGTTAFVVIEDGVVVRETYLNGYRRDSMTRSFSVTKSFTAALIGIALADGAIRTLDDPFVDYVPELRGHGYDGITIRHLLLMAAGFRFTYGRFPWADDTLLYYHPDVRRLILGGPPVEHGPGERFTYGNYSTLVLGLVLERVTGETISRYFERRLWQPIGAEYDALWSLDREHEGFEATTSGLNARPIDLVKLGTLYLSGGRWGDRQIFPQSWADASVTPPSTDLPGHSDEERAEGVYYKLGFWGHRLGEGRHRFYAHGYHGQFVYVCPEKRLVIARFGKRVGTVGRAWPMVLRGVADAMS